MVGWIPRTANIRHLLHAGTVLRTSFTSSLSQEVALYSPLLVNGETRHWTVRQVAALSQKVAELGFELRWSDSQVCALSH